MNNNEDLFFKRIQENNDKLFFQAYDKNDLKTMEWCLDSGICTNFKDNDSIDDFIDMCSTENRLDVLKLLHKYDWYGRKGLSFMIAVQASNWEMMKWLYEMGYSKDYEPEYMTSDDLEIMQWLKDRGFKFNEGTLYDAELKGFAETVKWLKKNI